VKLNCSQLRSVVANLVMVSLCAVGGTSPAKADLHWPPTRKINLRIRLIALAESDPRSSFFATQEVFVAAQQLTENESRLLKLVYSFLPYQPRLSEVGLDYSLVHEIHAVRDPDCDETLAAMTTDQRDRAHVDLKYSLDSPALNVQRRHSPLPCYSTTPEDYSRAVHETIGPETEF